jgi:far upstream element-binding protein
LLCSLALTAFVQTIRTMQAVSGAHIDIDQQVPMGHACIVTVSGPPGAIHACRSLLDDLLRTPVAAHPGQVTVPPGGLERIVLCSKQLVGRIIGRHGDIVKGLQAITGARIQIDQSTEPCRVSITGAPECAEACFRIVSDIAAGGHSAQYSYSAYMARTAQGAWAQTGHGVPATGAYGGGGAYGHTPSFSYGGAQFYGLQPPFAPQQTQGGWQAALDGQGRVYWFNAVTGMSQWEKPEGVP